MKTEYINSIVFNHKNILLTLHKEKTQILNILGIKYLHNIIEQNKAL